VTLADQLEAGRSAEQVLTMIASSIGLAERGEVVTPPQLADRFDSRTIPRTPWIFPAK